MQNFMTELDLMGVSTLRVTSTVRPSATSRTHLISGEWDWRQVRDYVLTEMEERFGPQTTDSHKLIGIFKGFSARWGEQAGPISRYVFESCGGMWQGKRVTVTSWCKGADPYFATPIAERLARMA
jgi:hypothetical protein